MKFFKKNSDRVDVASVTKPSEVQSMDNPTPYDPTVLSNEIASFKYEHFIDIYKIIVDTRKFEIENFWKRSLFFWGIISIAIAAYTQIYELPILGDQHRYRIFASYVGFYFNLIFSLSIRGSKYWQEHWEFLASQYEKYGKPPFSLFNWDAKKALEANNKKVSFLYRPYRFSVSKLTMILSDITLLLWIVFIIENYVHLCNRNLLFFQFSNSSSFDFFTLFTLIPFILIIPIYRITKK